MEEWAQDQVAGTAFPGIGILLQRADTVVTREELRSAIWSGDTFVDFDHGLNIAINKIREALGDSAENPRFVETLPKRGYRFIAPIAQASAPTAVSEGQVPSQSQERQFEGRRNFLKMAAGSAAALIGGAGVLALGFNVGGSRDWLIWKIAPPRIESIAVLPMENISGDSRQDSFADGMTDALITDLGQVDALRVISRTSVMGYKKTNKTLPEIGRELNVDAIVEETVLRTGDRVRITAQLLHAPTDRHLWAQSYERDVRDVLRLQGEVARSIAAAVMAELSPQAQERLARVRPIQPEAYENYLKGSFVGSAQQRIEPLRNATRLQPDYAPAFCSLASCYYILGLFGTIPPSEAYSLMKDASLAALEKDGGMAEAYAALGLVRLHYDWNWAEAERNFRRAIELNSNSADSHHNYAHYLLAMGRLQESVAESRKAVELDPRNAGLVACLGWHELYANRYDQTIEQAQKAIRLNPETFWPHLVLGWGYEQKGQYDRAIPAFEQAVALSRGRAIAVASLGHAYALSGRTQGAQKLLADLGNLSQRSYVPAYDVSTIYAGLNKPDSAFEWLDKAFEERSSFLVHINWDPRFKMLRSDPRFKKLLQQIGLPRS